MAKVASPSPVGSLPRGGGNVQWLPLSALELDPENPRFGEKGGKRTQSAIAEMLVEQYGVKDVLASLAVNGYFESEPVVARHKGDRYIVAEGNRRLCACLILAGDPRVSSLSRLRPVKTSHEWSTATEIPVLVMEAEDEARLLPYLGVRHIVGSQPWDSYAKARWIDEMLVGNRMNVDEISEAVGDNGKTIQRMLYGYRFIKQLIDDGRFRPEESHRKGRGSNTEFPFSWVYTLLGYSHVRDHLELEPPDQVPNRPIPARREGDAAKVMAYMLGTKAVAPAIRESRQISALADALTDPVQRDLLEQGRSLDEIDRLSKPPAQQLATLLREAADKLRSANGILSETVLGADEATSLHTPAGGVARLGNEVFKRIGNAVAGINETP